MKSLLHILLCLVCIQSLAQENSPYLKKNFIRAKDSLPYRIMYPANYDLQKKYPLILFLHGSGERGNDNLAQLMHGGSFFADSLNRVKFPAIVIFPQCPQQDFWAKVTIKKGTPPYEFIFHSDQPPTTSLSLVNQLLDSMLKSNSVDPNRIYLGGLSMGGMGSFELLWRKPGIFAAAFPICGAGDTTKPKFYGKNFPIWIFHGAADPVLDVSNSRVMSDALKKNEAKVKYTEYPGVGHESWANAFREPQLLPWLFSQQKKQ